MIDKIASELGIRPNQVKATVDLLDEGGTVPFISRYRKEKTGDLDEVQIMNVRDRITQLRELDKRREAILKSIEDQDKMTDELKSRINLAETMSELEDIYLPYKPRRRTKATIAREAGLEPLATIIFEQSSELNPQAEAAAFVDAEKGVENIEKALQGARDIMAEWINENADARATIRKLFMDEAIISSKLISGKEEEGQKYKDYFEWEESFKGIPSHRLLALRRGEKEMILSVDISPEEGTSLFALNNLFVSGSCPASEEVEKAARDSYKRLLKPSLETEARMQSKILADEEAIRVFANNLRELLLSSPLGEKKILAVDPGFRSGCKVVYLDKQGKLIENTIIYPNPPQNDTRNADRIVKALYDKYEFEAVAIGNGTAGRETERYIKALGLPSKVAIVQVNESGASIYSASEVAREEFPDYDLTVRGAVSIGRRLMDPLAELVKIDPKSIGVGQYQHDVDQNQLKQSLDDTVVSCVNAVGVDLNTASGPLLSYVSGLGPQLAKNIISYREENGPFKNRKALKKVTRLGDKAFEQSAGFLRITGAKNPLDTSAVHPERYELVEKMAKDLGVSIKDLMADVNLRKRIKLENYITEDVGLPTLKDIIAELEKPGRDPRQNFEAFQFDDAINSPEDLRAGMTLPGIITNITNFGVFVDVGVHQDGLVHISQLSDRFVKDPMEIVKGNQKVKVTVMEVDLKRKRIALSMKSNPYGKTEAPKKREEKREDKGIDLAGLKKRFS